ncbi:hypothetical protein A6E01_19330 (plasmid) [Vibrio breoganii]|uniref:Uncharacterized domain-containing protein n=1 Tax=Vibrio breoganii TaxID=553239 RepID=A0AAN0XZD4_9VIBR|nr:TraI domain-containing protein [Vibrio breoganii]ANO35368.1 hypothetical protein A6E01_19330 [Vibrio breoganii]
MFFKKKKSNVVAISAKQEERRVSGAGHKDELIFLDADSLLNTEYRQQLVFQIKECAGINDKLWNEFYMHVIKHLAIRFQAVPASESNHHSYKYGLLEHTLETALYAMRASMQYNYFPDKDEEKIQQLLPAFTYAVFVSAMMHDAGKAFTDVSFKVLVKDNWVNWSFMYGHIPSEKEKVAYRFQRRKEAGSNAYDKNSHELAAPSMLLDCVPHRAIKWISDSSDTLLIDMLHAISSDHGHDSAVHNSVIQGDKTSVEVFLENNDQPHMLHSTSQSQADQPLHLAYLNTFKEILANPSKYNLIINKRHSDKMSHVERAGNIVFASATQIVEIANRLLQQKGVSVPKANHTYQLLLDNNVTLKAPSGDSLWWADFYTERKQTRRDLSYLAFKAEFFPGFDYADTLTQGAHVQFSEKTLGTLNCGPLTKEIDGELHEAIYVNQPLESKPEHNQMDDSSDHGIKVSTVEKPLDLEPPKPAPSREIGTLETTEAPSKPAGLRAPTRAKTAKAQKSAKSTPPPAADTTSKTSKAKKPTSKVVTPPKEQAVDDDVDMIIPSFGPAETPKQATPSPEVSTVAPPQQSNDKDTDSDESKETAELIPLGNENVPPWLKVSQSREARKLAADKEVKSGMLGYIQQEIDDGRMSFNKKDSAIHYTKYGLFIVSPLFFTNLPKEEGKKYRALIKRSSMCYYNESRSIIKMLTKTDNEFTVAAQNNRVEGFLLNYHDLKHKGQALPTNEFMQLAPRSQQHR